jgi:hypothetical protein
MQVFRSTESVVDGRLTFLFEGPIDEEAQFPELAGGVSEIVIDLQFVRSINSYGIREWLNWIRPIAKRTKIEFMNCPKSIVLQFNTVEGFFPQNATVSSFYVPYFCELCDREKIVLFRVGEEIQKVASSWQRKYEIEGNDDCEAKPCQMESDIGEAKYFSFLKKLP